MSKLQFWKSFHKTDKLVFLSFSALIALLTVGGIIVNLLDIDLVLQWETVFEDDNMPVALDSFNTLLYDFNIEISQYLIFNHFDVTALNIKPWSWGMYLTLFTLGISLICTAISHLKELLSFYISATLITLLLIGLRFDGLILFGSHNPYLIAIGIIPVLVLLFLFRFVFRYTNLTIRLASFVGLFSVLGFIFISQSTLPHPEIHLANYAAISGSVLALLLLLFIASDNVWLIVRLTSASNPLNPKANFINFAGLTLLYLLFPLLLFLKYQGHISINLSYLNPLFLLIGSLLVSFWAIREKDSILTRFSSSKFPIRYLHLGLTVITLSLYSFNYLTYNASFILLFEKMIILAHLAFGCAFFVYIAFNFAGAFMQNLKVYKAIYEGNRLPYFTVILASLGIMYFTMMANYQQQYKQWVGGIFSLLGESEEKNDNAFLSEKFYNFSLRFHNHNFKASYHLGTKALQNGDHIKAEKYFSSAANFSGIKTPFTYIKLTNEHRAVNENFIAIWSLGQAKDKHPRSGEIFTNLAVALKDYNFTDSAITCFQRAYQLLQTDNSNANTIGMLAKTNLLGHDLTEILLQNTNNKHYESTINLSALYNLNTSENNITFTALSQQEALTTKYLAYIHNYTLNTTLKANNDLKKELLHLHTQLSESPYYADINFLLGYYEFYNGNKADALNYFRQTLISSEVNLIPYYGKVIGELFMSKQYYHLAKEFLEKSIEVQRFYPINNAPLLGAITAVMLNDTSFFKSSSSRIHQHDSTSIHIIQEISPILKETNPQKLASYTDRQKIMFAQTRADLILQCDHKSVLNSFENENLKAYFIACAISQFSEFPEIAKPLNEYYWNFVPEKDMEEYTINELNFQYLNLLQSSYRFNELLDRIPTMTFNKNREKDIYYFSALALQALKDSAAAEENYKKAMQLDALNPKLILAYSSFLKNKNLDEAYQLISNAISTYPNDLAINKEFCLQALQKGYYHIAERTLRELEKMHNSEAHKAFELKFKKLEKEQTTEIWQDEDIH